MSRTSPEPGPEPSSGPVAGTAASDAAGASDKLDRRVIVTGLVIVAGMIMVILDTTIVNVALDSLNTELNAALSTTQWVVTGYMLAVAMVIPITGWAMDRFGSKPVWITALTLFVLGSALCATAWNIESLVSFRILQGLGGGMLLPAGQAIIVRAAGPQRVGRAMALLGVPMLLGPVFGPMLGGFLIEYTTWHWIFLVNVPVGALAIGLAAWKLSADDDPSDSGAHAGRLDVRGLILLSGSFAALLYGLSQASSHGGFSDAEVYGWLLGGALGLALYTWHSLTRGAASIIDVRLFTNRVFANGSATIFLVAVALFGSMLLLPLYFQTVRDQGALAAGSLLALQGIGAIIPMIISGRLTDRIGAGYVVPVGVLVALIGTFPFTQVGVDTSFAWLSIALFVRGMGLGAIMMPTISAAYSTLSKDKVSRAAPTISAIQQIGGSLGAALLVTALIQHLTSLMSDHGIQSGAQSGGADQLSSIPAEAIPIIGPLLADSFAFAFWVAFALTALIIIPALALPRHATRNPDTDQVTAAAL